MSQNKQKQLRSEFRSHDQLGPNILTELHLDQELEQKTYCGAVVTLSIQLLFFALVIKNFVGMMQHDNTYITSIEKTLLVNETEGTIKHPIGNMSSMFFVVKDYQNKHQTLDLVNKYVYMEVTHTVLYFNKEGELQSEKTKSQLEPCDEEHFSKTDFTLNYYKNQVKHYSHNFQPFCFKKADLKNFFLQGFQESRNYQLNNSFIQIKFYKCDYEDTPADLRANCATDIDEWLYDKVFEPYVFQQKVEFDNWKKPISEWIQRQEGIALTPSIKTIVWGRIRQNMLNRKDNIVQWNAIQDRFFQYVNLNTFKFNIPTKEIGKTNYGQLVLRLDQVMIDNTREVIQFDQFMESLAGMYGLMMTIGYIFFGGFVHLRAQMRWIKKYYRFRDSSEDNADNSSAPDSKGGARSSQEYIKANYFTNMSLFNSIRFYIKNETLLSCFCGCFKKTKEEIKFEKVITRGQEQLQNDFNIKQLIDLLHKSNRRLIQNCERDELEYYVPIDLAEELVEGNELSDLKFEEQNETHAKNGQSAISHYELIDKPKTDEKEGGAVGDATNNEFDQIRQINEIKVLNNHGPIIKNDRLLSYEVIQTLEDHEKNQLPESKVQNTMLKKVNDEDIEQSAASMNNIQLNQLPKMNKQSPMVDLNNHGSNMPPPQSSNANQDATAKDNPSTQLQPHSEQKN